MFCFAALVVINARSKELLLLCYCEVTTEKNDAAEICVMNIQIGESQLIPADRSLDISFSKCYPPPHPFSSATHQTYKVLPDNTLNSVLLELFW